VGLQGARTIGGSISVGSSRTKWEEIVIIKTVYLVRYLPSQSSGPMRR
jgi:hypothetical protein